MRVRNYGTAVEIYRDHEDETFVVLFHHGRIQIEKFRWKNRASVSAFEIRLMGLSVKLAVVYGSIPKIVLERVRRITLPDGKLVEVNA